MTAMLWGAVRKSLSVNRNLNYSQVKIQTRSGTGKYLVWTAQGRSKHVPTAILWEGRRDGQMIKPPRAVGIYVVQRNRGTDEPEVRLTRTRDQPLNNLIDPEGDCTALNIFTAMAVYQSYLTVSESIRTEGVYRVPQVS